MSNPTESTPAHKTRSFRRAVLRGLAVVLPPLLTVVIFLWVGSIVNDYILQPVKWMARDTIAYSFASANVISKPAGIQSLPESILRDDKVYRRLPNDDPVADKYYVPDQVYKEVANNLGDKTMPSNGLEAYRLYVETTFLKPQYVIPLFICVFVILLSLIGRMLFAGMGNFFLRNFELLINRLPIIRNVYGSVKQVTDFVFSESHVEYTRVVAIEYPRKGIWSLGLVTGESMLDIRSAANEPVVSVLIPTSPAPVTGYTVTVRKSEAVDLNLTIDQAFQFIVSCGVVVPPQQLQDHLKQAPSTSGDGSIGGASTEPESALPTTGS